MSWLTAFTMVFSIGSIFGGLSIMLVLALKSDSLDDD